MNKTELEKLEEEFFELTETMNVPQNRRRDIHWISRNIGVQNDGHENLDKVYLLIKKILKIKYRMS